MKIAHKIPKPNKNIDKNSQNHSQSQSNIHNSSIFIINNKSSQIAFSDYHQINQSSHKSDSKIKGIKLSINTPKILKPLHKKQEIFSPNNNSYSYDHKKIQTSLDSIDNHKNINGQHFKSSSMKNLLIHQSVIIENQKNPQPKQYRQNKIVSHLPKELTRQNFRLKKQDDQNIKLKKFEQNLRNKQKNLKQSQEKVKTAQRNLQMREHRIKNKQILINLQKVRYQFGIKDIENQKQFLKKKQKQLEKASQILKKQSLELKKKESQSIERIKMSKKVQQHQLSKKRLQISEWFFKKQQQIKTKQRQLQQKLKSVETKEKKIQCLERQIEYWKQKIKQLSQKNQQFQSQKRYLINFYLQKIADIEVQKKRQCEQRVQQITKQLNQKYNPDKTCKICMSDEAIYINSRCGHLVMCFTCYREIERQSSQQNRGTPKCPICRQRRGHYYYYINPNYC